MQEGDFAAATAALSTARLSNYRTFFSAASEAEVVGLYKWNEAVSIQLFRILSLAEIAVRNRFHSVLSDHYGAVGYPQSKDWYQFLVLGNNSKRSLEKVLLVRRHRTFVPRTPPPTPDDVISKLTFGFWPHLLDVGQDTYGKRVNWATLLPLILSGHRQRGDLTYWRQQAHRDAIFVRLDLCNGLRNRIAHHEPIWKAGPLLEEKRNRQNAGAIQQVAAAPTNVDEALTRLRLYYLRIQELIGWMCPALLKMHLASETHIQTEALLTHAAIAHHKKVGRANVLCLGQQRTLRAFKKKLKYLSKKGAPVRLYRGSKELAENYSMGQWITLPY